MCVIELHFMIKTFQSVTNPITVMFLPYLTLYDKAYFDEHEWEIDGRIYTLIFNFFISIFVCHHMSNC